jgi:hypothetical protein
MNMDHDPFEEKLRQIKPITPSPELMARLRATRPAPAPAWGWGALLHRVLGPRRDETPLPALAWDWRTILLRVVSPLAVTMLVALAVVFHFLGRGGSSRNVGTPGVKPITVQMRPVEEQECILGARELGVYCAPDGQVYRVVQCVEVNRQVWANTANGTRIEHAVPQQRVLLVSMNTY